MRALRRWVTSAPNSAYGVLGAAIVVLASVCRAFNEGAAVWTSPTSFYLVPVGAASFIWAGLLTRGRYRNQRMGLLLFATGCAYAAEDIQLAPWTVLHTIGLFLTSGSTVGMIAIALSFPTGRFHTPLDRWLMAGTVLLGYVYFPLPTLLWQPSVPKTLLHVAADDSVPETISFIFGPPGTLIACVGAALAGYRVLRRIRAVSPARRWVMTPFTASLGAWVVASLIWGISKAVGYGDLTLQRDSISFDELMLGLVMISIPWGFLAGIGRLGLARNEAIEALAALGPSAGVDDVVATLRRTLRQPDLTLDVTGEPQVEQPAPETVSTPVGATAVLHHDPVLGEDPRLLGAVGTAIRSVLDGRELTRRIADADNELAATRRRMISALDETRARIERNVHDGPQQRLMNVMLKLDEARALAAEGGSAVTTNAILGAQQALADAIDELRTLSHGEHPPVLRDFGLIAALRRLADDSSLPTTLFTRLQSRAAQIVEVTAYYVAAEAHTNALRHADATRVEIEVTIDDSALTLVISDDGRGGAAATGGSGIAGLHDRVAAIGGRLEVISPVGGGARVTAVLPVEGPAEQVA